ncbi:4'-phosphopantetheinyl transferase superfamily protein [Mycoplasma tauri]|uniref:4'-phosphopantetheinyl transferase superfamily protein n=2 Tax=Mycoplasma tauri TaxID=547987 RepID=A0A953NC82_9MOLU|nr:4'-phosphopantetheinyl transferase superfamily protein [Mycoplasma tauri]MBZ4195201.1 4'-phosphopantetheinyl transferase superfamily protein [Mycoplasma tauri]MBZ4204193.1 4'-phosphopantetheinyl transferase superfamily protein [Mycoplasma tauri]MBZ4217986.1 4'-phosphopantetheinyl transferase superfamily protein [Mycoplasma tauri]MBZ4226554.1 4'-phosphopantetheinyl transferase superfamily protein [Mycoplasma tauri]
MKKPKIGVDITKISRFFNKSDAFIKRVLSDAELFDFIQIEDIEGKAKFLAVRWAIKEAIFKADNSYVAFNKITIKEIDEGYLFKGFDISTSSEDDYIIATVLRC